MACQNRKSYFKLIWYAISPQFAFHENVGQPCESLFFLPSESENRIEKSRFFLVSMTLKKACRFSIFEKITDVSKIITSELIDLFSQKL